MWRKWDPILGNIEQLGPCQLSTLQRVQGRQMLADATIADRTIDGWLLNEHWL